MHMVEDLQDDLGPSWVAMRADTKIGRPMQHKDRTKEHRERNQSEHTATCVYTKIGWSKQCKDSSNV
jgi:hypothetical protein